MVITCFRPILREIKGDTTQILGDTSVLLQDTSNIIAKLDQISRSLLQGKARVPMILLRMSCSIGI